MLIDEWWEIVPRRKSKQTRQAVSERVLKCGTEGGNLVEARAGAVDDKPVASGIARVDLNLGDRVRVEALDVGEECHNGSHC